MGDTLKFQRERIDVILNEGKALLANHFQEVDNSGFKLDINEDRYSFIESVGNLVTLTARNDSDELVGYGVFILGEHPQHQRVLCAKQEAFYMRPDLRGTNGEFLKWCDHFLEKETVEVIFQHVKPEHDWSSLLLRNGYKPFEHIYIRRTGWAEQQQA